MEQVSTGAGALSRLARERRLTANHSRAVERRIGLNHSRAVERRLTANHSRAIAMAGRI